jgi:O-antigen ligase
MLRILVLIFCAYLPFQIALNPIEGIDIASIRILSLIIALFWLGKKLQEKYLPAPSGPQLLLVGSFLFLSVFSIFFSESPAWALRKLFFLFSFFPLFLVFSDLGKKRADALKIIEFLLLGGALSALVGIGQFFLQFIIGLDPTLNIWREFSGLFWGNAFSQSILEYSSWLVEINGKTIFRAIAFFPDPHTFSFFLTMLLPWFFSVGLGLKYNERIKKTFLLLGGVAVFLANILTFSRSGYVGMLAGALFWGTALLWQGKFLRKKVLALVLFGLLLTSFSLPFVQSRFVSIFNPNEGSNSERYRNWKEALKIVSDHPLVGVGLGNYSLAVKSDAAYRDPIYAHNLYLDIAAETGIINALVFVALLAISLVRFMKKSACEYFWIAGAISLVSFGFQSLFDTSLFSVQALPLFVILIALSATQKND